MAKRITNMISLFPEMHEDIGLYSLVTAEHCFLAVISLVCN